MEIEFLHRNNLAVTTTGRATLDPEGRSLAGLANAGEYLLSEMRAQSLAKPHRGGGLSFAQRSGSDRRHHNVFAVWYVLEPVPDRKMYLGFRLAVEFQF